MRYTLLAALAAASVTHAQQPAPPAAIAAQPSKPATAFIFGRVVDAGSGRPVPSAIVSLVGNLAGTAPAAPDVLVAEGLVPATTASQTPTQLVADGEGRFVFRGLVAGRYGLSVRAAGYVIGSYGQRRPGGPSRQIAVEDNQKLSDVTVKLWKYASIAGRVHDEAGEPAVGISVNLLRITTVGGRRRLAPSTSVTTDDRGMYRYGNLIPGSYLVQFRSSTITLPTSALEAYQQAAASGPGGSSEIMREFFSSGIFPTTGVRVGDNQLQFSGPFGRTVIPPPPAGDGRMSVYQTVFYPSATLSSQASTITLASGEERSGIDLQLKLTRAVTVSGVVLGPDGPAPLIGVRLQSGGLEDFSSDTGLETATSITAQDGSFTFLGVPSGQYTLKAQKVPRPALPSTSTMTTVINTGAGGWIMTSSGQPGTPPPVPTDSTLWAQMSVVVGESDVRGVSVSLNKGARVSGRIEFLGAAPRPAPERVAQMIVTMSSADGAFVAGFTPARPNAEGTFSTMSYPPGRYTLSVNGPPAPWTIRSITVAGKDAFGVPLELGASDLAGVVVTLSDASTELSGAVRASGTAANADAQVVIFPADVQGWIASGMSARRARTSATSTSGDYRITGLPPGDYLIVALDPEILVELQDPQLVSALARAATRVSLVDGDKKSLPLTTSQIR